MRAPFLICVGNAIVDILVKVEDSFLNSNDLIKGSMSLVNNEEFDNIFSNSSLLTKDIEPLFKLFNFKKESSTLISMSTIAFPTHIKSGDVIELK